MKIKLVLLFVFLSLIVLIFGVDVLYDKTMAQQEPQQSQPLKVERIKASSANSTQLESPPPHVIAGFDWSLPASTTVESNSGLIAESNRNLATVNNRFIIVRWDKTNPKKGVYDFSSFDKQLKQLAHKKALVRLEVNSSCEAPAWALQQLRATKDKSLIFWDENYLSLLKPYVEEFAKRYAHSSQIVGVQLGIADGEYRGPCDNFDNKDGWGEFWMSPKVIAESQQSFGFTPEIFEARSKEIIEFYAKAFGINKHKLAYTNLGSFSWDEIAIPYNQKMKILAQYAFDIGLGNRDGGTEQWMEWLTRIFGNDFTSHSDGSCSLDFDEKYADTISGRYWGTENEFYGNKDYVLNKHGPYENQPYRFLISSLRALQMRRNFVSVSDDSMAVMKHPLYKTQDFLVYLSKVLGKDKVNTPDAFILLGERYITPEQVKDFKDESCVKNSNGKVAIRSFGRWLTEKSQSKPALKVSMPAEEKYWAQNFYLPDGVDYEYSAREGSQFSFNLNDELSIARCINGCPVEIKVTYKDTLKTTLTVQVAEGVTRALETKGDNQIKTASFKVNSKFENGVSGSDFILKSETGAIPLILLRVNFL